jgi:hypothetical protein
MRASIGSIVVAMIFVISAGSVVDGQVSIRDLEGVFERSRAFRDGVVDCPLEYDSRGKKFVCSSSGLLSIPLNARSFNVAAAQSPIRDCTSTPCTLVFTDNEDLKARMSFTMPSVPLKGRSVMVTWRPSTSATGTTMWAIQACAYSDAAAPCTPIQIAARQSIAPGATNQRASAEISFSPAWPPGSTVIFGIARLHADPGDTLAGDVYVEGVRLELERQ